MNFKKIFVKSLSCCLLLCSCPCEAMEDLNCSKCGVNLEKISNEESYTTIQEVAKEGFYNNVDLALMSIIRFLIDECVANDVYVDDKGILKYTTQVNVPCLNMNEPIVEGYTYTWHGKMLSLDDEIKEKLPDIINRARLLNRMGIGPCEQSTAESFLKGECMCSIF